jgi:hypothetical protein
MSDSRQQVNYHGFFQQDFFLIEIDDQNFIDLLGREGVGTSLLDEFRQCKNTILSSANVMDKATALQKMHAFLLTLKPTSQKSEEAILPRLRLVRNAIKYIASECEAEKFLLPLDYFGAESCQIYSRYNSIEECITNRFHLTNSQNYWTAFYTAAWVRRKRDYFLRYDNAVGVYNSALGSRLEWLELPENERVIKMKDTKLLSLLENVIKIIKDYLALVEREENYSIHVQGWQQKLVTAEKTLLYISHVIAKNTKAALTADEIRAYINGEISEPDEMKSISQHMP